MSDKPKKKPSAANYAVDAAAAGLGVHAIADHNAKARRYDTSARIAENQADKLQADHDRRYAAWRKAKEGTGDAKEHEELAHKYKQWASRSSSTHPYVTPELREEAVNRYHEHSQKARSARGNPGQPPLEPMNLRWARTDAKWARSSAKAMRTEGKVIGGTLIGAGAVSAGITALRRHKFDESKHRRNQGKFATTGGVKKNQETAVEKNLSAEEIFSKAREIAGPIERPAAQETVAKSLSADEIFAAARGEVSKGLLTDAGEIAGKIGRNTKNLATDGAKHTATAGKFVGEKARQGFNATDPARKDFTRRWNRMSPGRQATVAGSAGAAGGIGLGAAAQSRKH